MPSSSLLALVTWISGQAQPPPPKRTFLRVRPTTSEGMKAFLVQYNRLIAGNHVSNTAFTVYRAVQRAETGKDLISRLPQKFRQAQTTLDDLSALQLSMFGAANWTRRYVDDRNADDLDYSFLQEQKEGMSLAEALDAQVRKIFERVTEKSQSNTVKVAFQAFEIKWRKEDEEIKKIAEKENERAAKKLQKAFEKAQAKGVEHLTEKRKFQFRKAVADLEDSRAPLTDSQKKLAEEVTTFYKGGVEDAPVPEWRVGGIKTLGPFGIASSIDIELSCEYPSEGGRDATKEKLNGVYTMKGPAKDLEEYSAGLGGDVKGLLSPLESVTIKATDPAAKLIRIPEEAKFFAFAYPVITADSEVSRSRFSPTDAFLLYGGYIYFDSNLKIIRVNALWVGSNLQLSAPRKLPDAIKSELLDADRFRDITLPQLWESGARKFCWILPGEFPDLNIPHGGWCYIYENEEVNNYFSIASADSVQGTTSVVYDIPEDD